MAAPPPELMDDLIGEILLRLPPDDPACLFRAALVCKPWRRLLSDGAFLRRYRAFHQTPPVLGFLHDVHHDSSSHVVPHFVSTTGEASPPIPQPEPSCWTLDCRHGRVLLYGFASSDLVVWDPISGNRQEIPQPLNQHEVIYEYFAGAVLCASAGCGDHHECRHRRGPFVVVFVGTDIDDAYGDDEDGVTSASVYSSTTGEWSAEVSIHLGPILENREVIGRSLLAGEALYFAIEEGRRILKYDLGEHLLSVIEPPPLDLGNMVLVNAEDGRLGAAGVKGYSLHFWSWRIGADSVGEWVPGRVIELDMMISIGIGDPTTNLNVVGFAEGAGSIFVNANDGIFTVEMKSGSVKKIGNRGDFSTIYPFMSFYTPDHASTQLQMPIRIE